MTSQFDKRSRRVVFTVALRGYDLIANQTVKNINDIPFICFTDDSSHVTSPWQPIKLELALGDAHREIQDPKIRVTRYLKDFDESLYIDPDLVLTADPADIFDQINKEVSSDLACLPDDASGDLFSSAEQAGARITNEEEQKLLGQLDFYRKSDLPRDHPLPFTGFLFRRHGSPALETAMDKWMSQFLRHSCLENVALAYVLWKESLKAGVLDHKLSGNPYFEWPLKTSKLPVDFDPEEYLWLNPDLRLDGVHPAEHYRLRGQSEKRRYRYHKPIDLDRLANRFRSDKGRLFYNAHFYARVYQHYLGKLREQDFSLLEIGLLRDDVQAGLETKIFDDAPSLRMWKSFFPKAKIFGFDIGDFSDFSEERCRVIRGDQGDRSDLQRAIEIVGNAPQVIIDDASHASHHQQITLGALFPSLAKEGLFFIEDLRYQPRHLEQDGAPKTRHVLKDFMRTGRFTSPFIEADEAAYLEAWIEDIRFYDSFDYNSVDLGSDAIAVIRKKRSK